MRVLVFLAACATAPSHPANEAMSLGAWCHEAGRAMCKALADKCFNGMDGVADGCNETVEAPCLAGRARDSSSGRTWGELDQCVAQMRSLTCEGLGAGMGSGSLAQSCAAR
jgi:hypothetical protein